MKTLDEVKQMMAAGDTAQADEALKELLANEPDDLQAKMLYGTCRQLLGDEETFKRIHDELVPVMKKLVKDEPKMETITLWKKYHALWMTFIVGGLVLTGLTLAVIYLGNKAKDQMEVAGEAMIGETEASLYAGPQYFGVKEKETTNHHSALRFRK